MTTATSIISRVREIWSELDYAQRRLFEIRTGLPSEPAGEHSQGAQQC